jgi:hypothetical protein
MTGVLDLASMVEAAREAAAAGDFPAAARLLRDVSVIQEATLGSLHPELAKTLTNLALVCEHANNLVEAEQCYRRAHKIAVASLGPRDPFVSSSIKNLVDFCAAHDIPIWTPREGPSDDDGEWIGDAAAPDVTPAVAQADDAGSEVDAGIETAPGVHRDAVPVINRPRYLMIVPVAVGIAAIVIVMLVVRWRGTVSTTISTPIPSTPTSAPTPDTKPTVAVKATAEKTPAPDERPAPRATTVASQPVTVLKAQLCSALDRRGSPDWRCTPTLGNLRPGTYTFYTRLMATSNTTVQHRWYFNDRVHQVMRLRVSPNPNGGYRTFSSNRIIRERAGNWRVELRAADGTLLQEERFVVR